MKQYLSKELLQSVRSYNDLVKVATKISASIKSCSATNNRICKKVSTSSDDLETYDVNQGRRSSGHRIDVADLPADLKEDIQDSADTIKALVTHIDMLKSTLLMAEYYSNLRTYSAFVKSLKALIEEAQNEIESAKENLRAIAKDTTPQMATAFSDSVKRALFGTSSKPGLITKEYFDGLISRRRFVVTEKTDDGTAYLYQYLITIPNFKSMIGIDDSKEHVYPYFTVAATTKVAPAVDAHGTEHFVASNYVQALASKLEPGHFEIGTLVDKEVKPILSKIISAYNSNILTHAFRETIPKVGTEANRILSIKDRSASVRSIFIDDDQVTITCSPRITEQEMLSVKAGIYTIVRACWPGATPSIEERSNEKHEKVIEFFVTRGAKAKKPIIDKHMLYELKAQLGLDDHDLQHLKVMMLKSKR